MTDLRDRLQALAADATDGTQLRRPDVVTAPHRRRMPRLLAVTVAALAAIAGMAVIVARSGDDSRDLRVGPAASNVPTSAVPTTVAPTPTAHDGLVSFINAARKMDTQLKTAAHAINSTGPPWNGDESRAAAVRAADLNAVTAALPPGLPPSIVDATYLVYSDLASRRFALRSFEHSVPEGPSGSDGDLTSELRMGSAAAARFATDLAALEEQSKSTPPFETAAPDSRAAAEVAVVSMEIIAANSCCAATGGEIFLRAPVVTWTTRFVGGSWDGEVRRAGETSGIPFKAHFAAGKWVVELGAG